MLVLAVCLVSAAFIKIVQFAVDIYVTRAILLQNTIYFCQPLNFTCLHGRVRSQTDEDKVQHLVKCHCKTFTMSQNNFQEFDRISLWAPIGMDNGGHFPPPGGIPKTGKLRGSRLIVPFGPSLGVIQMFQSFRLQGGIAPLTRDSAPGRRWGFVPIPPIIHYQLPMWAYHHIFTA